ncbi:MAG: Fpg/Nei family DNA glycosylase [Thermoplasmatota archaeon]
MPELPDVDVYVDALRARIVGQVLRSVRLASPFLLRTVDPPIAAVMGRPVREVRRMGKRIVWEFDEELSLVIHLMIAGRLHWKKAGAKVAGRAALAAFDFDGGTVLFTEASSRHRASLHILRGEATLRAMDPGGLEPLTADRSTFRAALRRENHTLKRALADPTILSGIGNAYSDEILHRAKLSPLLLTAKASDAELTRLWTATQSVLGEWRDRLAREANGAFPEKVTAFRPGMAVHGRFGEPCPACGTPVQRIAYGENECNYCPRCQAGGKLLADRSLSRLFHADWPKTIDEWELRKAAQGREAGAGTGAEEAKEPGPVKDEPPARDKERPAPKDKEYPMPRKPRGPRPSPPRSQR